MRDLEAVGGPGHKSIQLTAMMCHIWKYDSVINAFQKLS